VVLVAPCAPWVTVDEFKEANCCDLPDGVTDALILQALEATTHLLWARSGRRYGSCPVEVRPWRTRCSPRHTCRPCSCSRPCEVSIYLDGTYIADIDEVVVDGEVVDESAYVLVRPDRLVRLDGACWPACPDLSREGDGFSVVARAGIPVDSGGLLATESWACELAKACIPGCDCRLPSNVVMKVRQGTTIRFKDLVDLFAEGLTGIDEVDLWLSSVNPGGSILMPAAVWSPDLDPEPLRVHVPGGS